MDHGAVGASRLGALDWSVRERCFRPLRRPPSLAATCTSTTATPGSTTAELILAHTATLTTTVQATSEFLPPGSLVVTKTIAGPAAGSQKRVAIHVDCDDDLDRPEFIIRAGAPAGPRSRTKTIAGPLAGQQGTVVIHTVCNGTALTPDFVIPAGATGDQSLIYSNVPAPASCVVRADGRTHRRRLGRRRRQRTNGYCAGRRGWGRPRHRDLRPRRRRSADHQDARRSARRCRGPVTIHVVCNGTALSPDFVIRRGPRLAACRRLRRHSGQLSLHRHRDRGRHH